MDFYLFLPTVAGWSGTGTGLMGTGLMLMGTGLGGRVLAGIGLAGTGLMRTVSAETRTGSLDVGRREADRGPNLPDSKSSVIFTGLCCC